MTSRTLSASPGQLKAIETVYNGYRFRSRLEARWAVFFDTLDVEYQYEPEGFDLGNGIWYLPDFWLPRLELWVEIKPTEPDCDERQKAYLLSVQSENAVLIIYGSPNATFEERYDGMGVYTSDGFKMVLFTGEWWDQIPTVAESALWYVQWLWEEDGLPDFLKGKCLNERVPNVGNDEKSIRRLICLDKKYYQTKYGKEEHWRYKFGRQTQEVYWQNENGKLGIGPFYYGMSERQGDALLTARQARFEHGENG